VQLRDDPTPIDEQNEYCVVQIDINKQTAEADDNAAGRVNRKVQERNSSQIGSVARL